MVKEELKRCQNNLLLLLRVPLHIRGSAAFHSVFILSVAAAVRDEYPSTGKWILQNIKIRGWMDPKMYLPVSPTHEDHRAHTDCGVLMLVLTTPLLEDMRALSLLPNQPISQNHVV